MTGEERKALSFVALLLGLSVVARAVNRPESVLASGAATVDIHQRLQQNQQVRERVSKASTSKNAKPPKPAPSSVPAWRRAGASVIEYKAGAPVASLAPIDLNRATAEQLDQLPGVSPALAQRIIEYRGAAGGFRSFEQLDSVKGIGPALLAKLEPLVRVR